MRQPEIYTAEQIKEWPNTRGSKNEQGVVVWKPARPVGHNVWAWWLRWQTAWKVLTGKYDALYWED